MKDTTLVIAFVLFQGIVFSTRGRIITELEINESMEKDANANGRSINGVIRPVLVEGDIIDTPELQRMRENKGNFAESRDVQKAGKWPNGVVPYMFDSRFSSSMRSVVKQAIARFNLHTCIKWIPRTTQKWYATFFHGSGCYSWIGCRYEARQKISLHPTCYLVGIAQHEMMHAVGFYHEQSRLDRDKYIKINFNNIIQKNQYNFVHYQQGAASTLGSPYDKQSLMHYGNYDWALNRRIKTITSLSNPNEFLGQRNGFSKIDIVQLNKHYGCPSTGTGTKPVTAGGSCPKHHPYAYHNGDYCCKSNKEKSYRAQGAKCDGSAISITSSCCEGDKYFKCPKPPCSNSPTKISTECKDQYQFCVDLENKDKWCKNSHRSWVAYNCKKTCNGCTTVKPTPAKPIIAKPQSVCKDEDKNCAQWAKANYCTSTNAAYRKFMEQKCKKSCGKCSTTVPLSTKAPSSSCVDKGTAKNCAFWKKSGYCQNALYKNHMKVNCPKSCGLEC